jgi:hypothetical protein
MYRRADAEFTRRATYIDIDRVPAEGILDAERIRMKGQRRSGTGFNDHPNGQGLHDVALRRWRGWPAHPDWNLLRVYSPSCEPSRP